MWNNILRQIVLTPYDDMFCDGKSGRIEIDRHGLLWLKERQNSFMDILLATELDLLSVFVELDDFDIVNLRRNNLINKFLRLETKNWQKKRVFLNKKDFSLIRGERSGRKISELFSNQVNSGRFFSDPLVDNRIACQRIANWILKYTEESPTKFCIVLRDRDDYAGFLLVTIDVETGFLHIDLNAVHEKFRGQGRGAQIIETAVGFAQSKGCLGVMSSVSVENRAALRCYKMDTWCVRGGYGVFHERC